MSNLAVQAATTSYQLQGPRAYQEDFYLVVGDVLAVMDGHGGQECALYCKNRLPSLIEARSWDNPGKSLSAIVFALAEECADLPCGSALSMVHIAENCATVAILGDCPVIIIDAEGQTNISPEHNVRSNEAEAAAAVKKGGFISNGYLCNRSGAGLQMSRALGDRALSDVLNTVPEIYAVTLGPKSAVLVASDGVIDPSHFDSSAHEAVASLLHSGADATEIVKSVRLADNATAIVWRKRRGNEGKG